MGVVACSGGCGGMLRWVWWHAQVGVAACSGGCGYLNPFLPFSSPMVLDVQVRPLLKMVSVR